MKNTTTIIFMILLFASCKKNRECECKNSGGTYIAGEVEASKIKAKKLCEDLSTANTECYLK
jgi:hypothetical protein